jgi:hypothetical protein
VKGKAAILAGIDLGVARGDLVERGSKLTLASAPS